MSWPDRIAGLVQSVVLAAAVALIVFIGSLAYGAEAQCTEYRVETAGAIGAWASSLSSACTSWGAANVASYPGGPNAYGLTGSATVLGVGCRFEGHRTLGCISTNYPSGCGVPQPYTEDVGGHSERLVDCPENDCPVSGTEAFIGGGSTPGSACVNGCQYDTPLPALSVGGSSGTKIYQSVSTGQLCDGSEPAAKEGSCVTSAAGRFCASDADGKNCGTFNGDKVCVESIPPGTCVGYASGGVACAADADEKPNNGTEGVDATPTGEVKKDGQTINYYNSSTVANSTNSITTTNNNGGTGDSGSEGDGEGEEEEIPGDIQPGEFGTVQTYEGAGSEFMGRVSNSAIVSSVSGLGTSIPAGDCPTWNVEVFGQEVELDQLCTIMDTAGPILSACAMFAWVIMGAILLFKA